MPFRIMPSDKNAQAMLRRIACEQIDRAMAVVDQPGVPAPDGIHDLRKVTKKLRGLLRLVRPEHRGFRHDNAVLRRCAAHAAALRDAEVMADCFARLSATLPDGCKTAPGQAALAAAVEERVAQLRASTATAEAMQMIAQALAALRRRARRWRLRRKGFGAIDPAIARSWADARRGLARAHACGLPDSTAAATPFHDWRKPVKHHWYHARLLRPIWPQMMDAHITAVDALGAVLGDLNDLDVLLAHLDGATRRGTPERAAFEALAEAGHVRRRALADAALRGGTRLFAEPPEALVARWKSWRRCWREDMHRQAASPALARFSC